MKIIIPVAGIGSKLRPHTHTQPKALVPVAGKPILSHIVDNLLISGFNDFIFVIGYLGDKIEDYIKSKYPDIKSTFIVQEPREGTGHAVWLTRSHTDENDELLIVLGDTIIDFDLRSLLKQPNSMLGVKKVEDPRQFGVAEIDEHGFIVRLTEKPTIPKSRPRCRRGRARARAGCGLAFSEPARLPDTRRQSCIRVTDRRRGGACLGNSAAHRRRTRRADRLERHDRERGPPGDTG